MCRHVAAHFPQELPSAAAARAMVADQLDRWELDDPDGSIVLLVSELVTNAVRHAGTPVELSMAVAEGTVEVGVADSDPRVVAHLRPDEWGDAARTTECQSEGGRGLSWWTRSPRSGARNIWPRESRCGSGCPLVSTGPNARSARVEERTCMRRCVSAQDVGSSRCPILATRPEGAPAPCDSCLGRARGTYKRAML